MTEYSSQALLSSRLKPSEASSPTQGPCSVDPSILLLSGSSWNPSREGQSLGKRPHPVSMNKLAYKLNSLQIRDPSPWPTAFPSHRSCQSNAPLVFHSWLVCLVGFSSSSSETPIKAHSKPPFCWEKIVNRHEATFNNWRRSFWRAALAPQPKNCQETSKEGTMSATTWQRVPSLDLHVSPALYLTWQEHLYFLEIWNLRWNQTMANTPRFLILSRSNWCQSIPFHDSWRLSLQLVLTAVLASSLSAGARLTSTVSHYAWQTTVVGGRRILVSTAWYLTDVWSALLPKRLFLRRRSLSGRLHFRAALKTNICCRTLAGWLDVAQ